MDIFRAFRRFRGTILIALVAAYAFFPAMKLLQSYHDHAEPDAVTEVAATTIESPGHGTRVCNHHPQGCPNDCFCPSISTQTEVPNTEGQLREPFLVQCADEVAFLSGPVLSVFLPLQAWKLPRMPESLSRIRSGRSDPPLDPFKDSPLKIPII